MSSRVAVEMQGSRWKRYPAYRDSGVEWLGEVPEGWEKTFIKRLAANGYKKFIDGDWIESPFITNYGIRLIQTGNIGIGSYKEQGFRYIDEKTFNAFNCTEVKPHDILICRLAEPVGRACLAPDIGVKMITSVDVCILKPSSFHDPKFIVYFFSSKEYLTHMNSLSRGSTRERVSRYMLGNIEFITPSLHEQRAIAVFLDRETGRIDTLIEKKERQVELLQEKRAALISHAVTKGLNPDVKMKDSGVEWLGEIPEHWEVKRLKHVCSLIKDGTHQPPARTLSGIPLLSVRNIINGKFVNLPDDSLISEEDFNELQRSLEVKKNDVLLAIVGATIGKVAVVEEMQPFTIQRSLAVLRPNINVAHYKYSSFFLRSSIFQRLLWKNVGYSAQPGIYLGTITNFNITVPDMSEQRAIAAFLDRETGRIDTLITKVSESISNLREYRTALISAAVTGKIDVREDFVS